ATVLTTSAAIYPEIAGFPPEPGIGVHGGDRGVARARRRPRGWAGACTGAHRPTGTGAHRPAGPGARTSTGPGARALTQSPPPGGVERRTAANLGSGTLSPRLRLAASRPKKGERRTDWQSVLRSLWHGPIEMGHAQGRLSL